MNTEPQTKDSLTATFKWYARILTGALLLCLIVAGLSMLTAKRAEGVVAAAVSVVNTQLSVDTEYPARIPFQATVNAASDGSFAFVEPAQPADKLWVIEDVDGSCATAGTAPVELTFVTTVSENGPFGFGPQEVFHKLVPIYIGLGPDNLFHWSFHEHTHYYNSNSVPVGASSASLGPSGSCSVNVSGYLVKPPA